MTKLFLLLALAMTGATWTFGAQAPTPVPAGPAATSTPTTISGVPDTLANGFLIYMKSGYATAVEAWSRGSSLEIDANAQLAVTKSLSAEESVAGTFIAPEIIKTVNLSPSSMLVYIFGKYQRGGLYMCFACYKSQEKWLVTSIDCDGDPAKVLPEYLRSGQ